MAFFDCKLKSQALAGTTTVRLFWPGDIDLWRGQAPRAVFTLLHGFTNDGDDWVNFSAALRYAADNNIALVIPDAANSFYNDMAAGPAYYTWLTQELPALLGGMVQLPAQREKNFVCGLSMGGYGALLLGLTHPEAYAGCASFSGAVDMRSMLGFAQNDPRSRMVMAPVFGPELALPAERDLFALAEQVCGLEPGQRPKVLCTVGRQDMEPYYIYQQNQNFREFVRDRALPLDYTYMEWDGVHEWNFWDRSLVHAIDLFLNPGYADKKLGDWAAEAAVERPGREALV
ncbi:alpha/beta hydrolase [Allofournierella sp.]|uniref:alpha/beta hydrolase n=1 Tax=Allofournierella sp. TaxID=1940256 RepID=UPI003AB11606